MNTGGGEQTSGLHLTEKPKPWLQLIVTPNPHSRAGRNTLIIARRGYRSKWTTLVCFCRHQRKDGTCKTLDQLTPILRHPERVRFEHDTRAREASAL